MKLLSTTYQKAIIASIEASKIIMTFYENGFESQYKEDGSPVTEADFAASLIIAQHLEETNIPILSEESEHAPYSERQHWEYNWCVDPLDGTKEFIKRNGEFAVNIALIHKSKPVFGVIAWPEKQKVIFGGTDIGVFVAHFHQLSDRSLWEKLEKKTIINQPLVMATSRLAPTGAGLDFFEQLKEEHPLISLIQKGSALKFFDLAYGYADIYPRFAPTMEWDIAAGQAILEALGGTVLCAITNTPLHYNKENLLNPHFIAKTNPLLKNE